MVIKSGFFKIETFSIIDSDDRYNEVNNINATVKDLGCNSEIVELKKNNFLENLIDLIQYHNSPVLTISSYIHSLLANSINKKGYKVAIAGIAADEIFTGYYDHFLLHLHSIKETESYQKNLSYWKKFIFDFVRNPILKDHDLYLKNPKFRDHIYDESEEISRFLFKPFPNNFNEKFFTNNLFSNRRLNELFHESIPLILNQEDLWWENRSMDDMLLRASLIKVEGFRSAEEFEKFVDDTNRKANLLLKKRDPERFNLKYGMNDSSILHQT